jgi:hypothetical protein
LASRSIEQGACAPRAVNCLQFSVGSGFSVQGTLTNLLPGDVPLLRLPLGSASGAARGFQEVPCPAVGVAGQTPCTARVDEPGAAPLLDGTVELHVARNVSSAPPRAPATAPAAAGAAPPSGGPGQPAGLVLPSLDPDVLLPGDAPTAAGPPSDAGPPRPAALPPPPNVRAPPIDVVPSPTLAVLPRPATATPTATPAALQVLPAPQAPAPEPATPPAPAETPLVLPPPNPQQLLLPSGGSSRRPAWR